MAYCFFCFRCCFVDVKEEEEEEGRGAERERERASVAEGSPEEKGGKNGKKNKTGTPYQVRHQVLGLRLEKGGSRRVDVRARGLVRVEGADVDSADFRGTEHWRVLFCFLDFFL